jgi:Ion transport protein
MPTYIGMALPYPDQNKFLYVLPLLRVVKVLRLMRLLSFLKNVDVARDLIFEALKQSALILSVFLFFVVVIIILFGCLIYLCEGGTYTVNSEYPRGAYLRMANTGRGLEATPFNSIATGMYWVISTGAGSGTYVSQQLP